MSRRKGDMKYIGPFLDARIQETQRQVKDLTGQDIGYKEAGEKLAAVKPIIFPDITIKKGKKKKSVGFDMFRGTGLF